MKSIIFILLLTFGCLSCKKNNNNSIGLTPILLGGKFGYVDSDLNWVHKLSLDDADNLYDGYGVFRKNGKCGVIDSLGKMRIMPMYDRLWPVSDKMIRVRKEGKYGFINPVSGKEEIPAIYDNISISFYNNRALVKLNEKWGAIDKSGNIILPIEFDDIKASSNSGGPGFLNDAGLNALRKNGLWRFINADLQEITPFVYKKIIVSPSMRMRAMGLRDGLWRMLNEQGEEIYTLPFNIDEKRVTFSNGFTIICDYKDNYAIIDDNDNIINIPFSYVYYEDVFRGASNIRVSNVDDYKIGFINKHGETIVPPIYDEASAFSGNYAVVKSNNKKGVINIDGTIALPVEYESIELISDSLFIVDNNNGQNLISMPEKMILGESHDHIYRNRISEGFILIKDNDKYGFIDVNGNNVIPAIYDRAGSFSDGLAAVEKDDKCGFIDHSGNIVIDLVFDSVIGFRFGLARVLKNGKEYYINKNGQKNSPHIQRPDNVKELEDIIIIR